MFVMLERLKELPAEVKSNVETQSGDASHLHRHAVLLGLACLELRLAMLSEFVSAVCGSSCHVLGIVLYRTWSEDFHPTVWLLRCSVTARQLVKPYDPKMASRSQLMRFIQQSLRGPRRNGEREQLTAAQRVNISPASSDAGKLHKW
ncbi:hypothetical protein GQ600_14923 [Phytophthora cactorum]|nr:hypothetical protein GQ600_14923 [Phytophthora cactorum]